MRVAMSHENLFTSAFDKPTKTKEIVEFLFGIPLLQVSVKKKAAFKYYNTRRRILVLDLECIQFRLLLQDAVCKLEMMILSIVVEKIILIV